MRTQRKYRPALDGALEDRVALTVLPPAAFVSAMSVQQAFNRNLQTFRVASPTLLATPAPFMQTFFLGGSPLSPRFSGLTTATPTFSTVAARVASNPFAMGGLTNHASPLQTTTVMPFGSGLLDVVGSPPSLFIPLPSLGMTNITTTTPVMSTAANGLGLSFNNSTMTTGINLGATAFNGMGVGMMGTTFGGSLNGFNTFGMGMI